MMWPLVMRLDHSAYPLSVVQRAAYSLADSLVVEVSLDPGHICISVVPAKDGLVLSMERARALVLQNLNDFALRDQVNRETSGLREVLARAALSGCGLPQ